MEWFLKEWIWILTCFLVFSSLFYHVIPGKQYKKYIQLFVGLLFCLLIIQLCLQKIKGGEEIWKAYEKHLKEWYEKEKEEMPLKEVEKEEEIKEKIEVGEIKINHE